MKPLVRQRPGYNENAPGRCVNTIRGLTRSTSTRPKEGAGMKPTRICSIDGCPRAVLQRGWCSLHYGAWRRYGDPNAPLKRTALLHTLEERIANKTAIDPHTGCWVWTAGLSAGGYAYLYHQGKRYRAHRLAYEHYIGPIPDGLVLDHACHNTACVNPAHLRPVTVKQNTENRSGVRSDNTSGYTGVSFYKGKWRGRVKHGDREYAALFGTIEEADAYARDLRNRLFTHNDLDRQEDA